MLLELNNVLSGNLTETERMTRLVADLTKILEGADSTTRAAFVTALDLTAFPVGTAVTDAVDTTDIVAQFNALLASLRSAGLIAE